MQKTCSMQALHAIILTLILLSGCANEDVKPPLADGRIKIALLVPLSGSSYHIGRSIEQAAKMAIEDRPQSKIDLEVIDTGSAPEISNDAVQQISNGKHRVLIGPLFAKHAKRVASALSHTNIPIITFSNDVSLAGIPNLYVAGFLPAQQIAPVINFAVSRNHTAIFALLPQNRYGQLIANSLAELKKEHVNIRAVIYYEPDTIEKAAQEIVSLTAAEPLDLTALSKGDI
jgi:ABC-type branched-subunit amino acid transport system substrate-binding protein